MPHHMTFWDFIVTEARGKSGPLFQFNVDVHARTYVEKDGKQVLQEAVESHPGKVVERIWYERNKMNFPCSRWENFNPDKKWDTYSTGESGIVVDDKGRDIKFKPGMSPAELATTK